MPIKFITYCISIKILHIGGHYVDIHPSKILKNFNAILSVIGENVFLQKWP